MVSEASRSDLGKKCDELGPARSEAEIAEFLQAAMNAGKLRPSDARVAALHLRGLLESEWFESFLFQVLKDITPKEINRGTFIWRPTPVSPDPPGPPCRPWCGGSWHRFSRLFCLQQRPLS